MRLVPVLCLVGWLAWTSVPVVGGQDRHAPSRGLDAAAMGFDQDRTTHHFLLFTDGGAIDVSAKDPADTMSRDRIRSHLSHIAAMFGGGDFNAPMLVHASTHVPGTDVMAARKDMIRYQYAATPNGGRVNIITSDAEALRAVHAFLTFQIVEHKTGDHATVRTR